MLPSNLRLGNDQLQRVAAVRLVDGVFQDTDSLDQVSADPNLAGEVGRIGDNLLGLGLELHGLGLVITVLHGSLDAGDLAAVIVEHLVDVGVQHVGATVDGRQTSETLGELTQAVERIDIGRLAVSGHGVDIKADAVDSLDGHAGFGDVVILGEQGHRVANEVAGVVLETKLVVNILHGARADVQA